MNKVKPEIVLNETVFLVDVDTFSLIEKDNQQNTISINSFEELIEGGYGFFYDSIIKNIPSNPLLNKDHTEYLTIDEFVELDPQGMAHKYGISLDNIKSYTDFDLLVNQKDFDSRIKYGQLPTIDILGQLFYVDLHMDMLRPKDDFLSKGISFKAIEDYYWQNDNSYVITYNPSKKEYQGLNYNKITKIPKDLVVIKIPFKKELDPVGWNKIGGWDVKSDLKTTGFKLHFKAELIPWSQTGIKQIIDDNLKRLSKTKDHGFKI